MLVYRNVNIPYMDPTVDGRNSANLLRLVVYPIIFRVLYIPGGAGISSINSINVKNNFLFGSWEPKVPPQGPQGHPPKKKGPTWRIIPLSKWLITMVNKSPK